MGQFEFLFAYYFKQQPLLASYALKSYEALEQGSTVVLVEEKDLEELASQIESSFTAQQSFVLSENRLTMQRYFTYEGIVKELISNKLVNSKAAYATRLATLNTNAAFLKELFKEFTPDKALSDKENVNWQLVALLSAYTNDFSLITGGPGTGKTSTVSKLLAFLFHLKPDLKVALTAQTGKAAARLKESLDNSRKQLNVSEVVLKSFDTIEPQTLHRLLGWVKDSVDFKHNANKPLKYDLVIVDECSMVDLPMMAKLMAAIDKDTKIILMGDQNQLPSVELGAVLADICTLFRGDVNRFSAEFIALSKTFLSDDYLDACVDANPIMIQDACVQLQRSYRFSSYKGLGLFASQLLNNETIDLRELSQVIEGEGVQSVATWGDKQIEHTLKGFEAYLKEKDPQKALTYFNHVRVLSSTYEGSLGVNQLNLKVEQYLSDHFGLNTKDRNYLNRPVMVTQNDYNLGLYNGDIGIIKLDEQGEKKVFFEDGKNGLKSFDPAFLSKVETVFTMTIHKSQGSEFKEVILVLPNNTTSEILCKELIYTAITRAKEKVVLVGTQEVFDEARTRTQNRMSNLNHLLR